MAYTKVNDTFASFDTGSEAELTLTSLSLAGAVDFSRLVWPQAQALAHGRPVHCSAELWARLSEPLQQKLASLAPVRRKQPQTGARNPKVLVESKRMPPSGQPEAGAQVPRKNANATLCVQLNRTWRDLAGKQPAHVLVRPMNLTLRLPSQGLSAEFAVHVDPSTCVDGALLLEFFIKDALGPKQVYERASTASAYHCAGACIVDASGDKAPIALPTNERSEDYLLGEAWLTECSEQVRKALPGGPTFDDLEPVLDVYSQRLRDVDSRYDVIGAPHTSAMPRPIHTPLSAALAARAQRPLTETSLPRFFWLQVLRYMPWDKLDASRKENIVARMLTQGFEEAGNPKDPADVLAHALMGLPRATGYLEDSLGDQLLLLFQYPVAHGDCEDIALLLMFIAELFMHSDAGKVCSLLAQLNPRMSAAFVREILALLPSRYRVVYVNNCANDEETQAHDMCVLMPTALVDYLLRDTKTRGQVPKCGPTLPLECMDDMQTRPQDRVAEASLQEAVDDKSYLNYCSMTTLEGQWLLVDTRRKGRHEAIGLWPQWLFVPDESARECLQHIRADPLFRWQEMCASPRARALLRGQFGAGAYAWRLSEANLRSKPLHITDAHELVPL